MRGIQGKPGWFWLFLLEGLLTFLIGLIVSFRYSYLLWGQLTNIQQSFFYLPSSPTNTKSVLCPRPWYTERQEVIMVNVLIPPVLYCISP